MEVLFLRMLGPENTLRIRNILEENMVGIVDTIKLQYKEIITEAKEDPVVDSWFLMQSPWPMALIIITYLLFVLIIGPKFMENRKAYDLSRIMMVYNLYQVIFSTCMFVWPFFVENAMEYYMNHFCTPKIDNNPIANDLRAGAWYYLFSKVVDLLDTVFFVLRKKQSHVSFLHVYHHSILVFGSWFYLKYITGEQGAMVGILNSFVHAVMYSYYFLSAFGPRFHKYLWWKKYLTKLQMLQFLLIIVYLGTLLAMDCKVPKPLSLFFIVNTAVFLVLFYNFYVRTYDKTEKKKDI